MNNVTSHDMLTRKWLFTCVLHSSKLSRISQITFSGPDETHCSAAMETMTDFGHTGAVVTHNELELFERKKQEQKQRDKREEVEAKRDSLSWLIVCIGGCGNCRFHSFLLLLLLSLCDQTTLHYFLTAQGAQRHVCLRPACI